MKEKYWVLSLPLDVDMNVDDDELILEVHILKCVQAVSKNTSATLVLHIVHSYTQF